MNVMDLIEQKLNLESEKCRSLWKEIQTVVEACKHHLTQITAQMPNYDIHDEKHATKVLENIEGLLDNKADQLSCYELILIYASAFLHDAAMALPLWEYNMLCAVEGCEEVHDPAVRHPVRNDFKPVHTLSYLKGFINKNKQEIYNSFSDVKGFIFSPNNEDDLQLDIAKRIQDYEEFRNEFAEQLESRKNNASDYLGHSNFIRSEFIRKTHHTRVEEYINNLRKRLCAELGEASAIKVLDDLSKICRAHGESIDYVRNLNMESNIDQIGIANLQFVSILLRLGDVIHFSSDRAPLSLLSEKGISNSTSLTHWKAKLNDTQYVITPPPAKETAEKSV